jgi:2-amino-4-hydroxy-6-hydroxymethyldihydropteridine diphosphokinase
VSDEPVVLSIGSNLGDREGTIRAAVRDIADLEGVDVTGASGLVRTAAVRPEGVDAEAPAYLNAVVLVSTDLAPERLLAELQRIELAHGRVRDVRWGDRTLDIDIVAYGAVTHETAELSIPHPLAAERAFVLAPWLQADPHAVLPGRGPVRDLLAATGESVTEYPAEPLL